MYSTNTLKLLRAAPAVILLFYFLPVPLAPAEAGWFSRITSGAKQAGKKVDNTKSSAPRKFSSPTPQQLASAAAAGGALVYYAEIQGTQLFLYLAQSAEKLVVDLSDNVVDHIRRSLDDVLGPAAAQRPTLFLSAQDALKTGANLELLAQRFKVRVILDGVGPLPLYTRLSSSGVRSHFLELRTGLVVPLGDELSDEVIDFLRQPVRSEAIRVAALFTSDDVEALRRFADAAGDRLHPAPLQYSMAEDFDFSGLQQKLLVLAGHVEKGAFVGRRGDGSIAFQINIRTLEHRARAADVTLISVGCNCYGAGAATGYLGPVTDLEVTAALPSLFRSQTYGELLAHLGARQNPYVITDTALRKAADVEVLRLKRLRSKEAGVAGAAATLRLARGAPGLLASYWVHALTLYGMGWLLAIVMFRPIRDTFLRMYPIGPAPIYRTRQIRAQVVREFLFFVLTPFVGLIIFGAFIVGCFFMLFSFSVDVLKSLFGSSSQGDDEPIIYMLVWCLFLKPHRFLIGILYAMVYLVAFGCGLVLLFTLLVLASMPILDIVLATDNVWVFLILSGLGLLVGWVALKYACRWLEALLDDRPALQITMAAGAVLLVVWFF